VFVQRGWQVGKGQKKITNSRPLRTKREGVRVREEHIGKDNCRLLESVAAFEIKQKNTLNQPEGEEK